MPAHASTLEHGLLDAAREDRPAAAPETLTSERSFAAAFLAERSPSDVRAHVSRLGAGLGLASLYGFALGARQGGGALLQHALGVPAAIAAVACLGVPALTIVLTLFNAPIEPPRALSAAARAAAATGLVLFGLAPAAALFVVTSEARGAAAAMGLLGLAIGGIIGLRVLVRDLKAGLTLGADSERAQTTVIVAGCNMAFLGFVVFAIALSLRVLWSTLPLLHGGAQ